VKGKINVVQFNYLIFDPKNAQLMGLIFWENNEKTQSQLTLQVSRRVSLRETHINEGHSSHRITTDQKLFIELHGERNIVTVQSYLKRFCISELGIALSVEAKFNERMEEFEVEVISPFPTEKDQTIYGLFLLLEINPGDNLQGHRSNYFEAQESLLIVKRENEHLAIDFHPNRKVETKFMLLGLGRMEKECLTLRSLEIKEETDVLEIRVMSKQKWGVRC
jgi:hypothetical protein